MIVVFITIVVIVVVVIVNFICSSFAFILFGKYSRFTNVGTKTNVDRLLGRHISK